MDAITPFVGLVIFGLFLYTVIVSVFSQDDSNENPRHIICPNGNCKYEGECRQQNRNNILLVVLILVFFPAAILYAIMVSDKYFCPKCGLEIGSGR